MVKIFPYVAGQTLNSHLTFLQKLKEKGAKEVSSHHESDVVIVFCPIVSRFETDITAALSNASEQGYKEVILVAMHHTFDENCTIPNHREYEKRAVRLIVDCLFFENMGLLSCPLNEKAVKSVCKELELSRGKCLRCCFSKRGKEVCCEGRDEKKQLNAVSE